MPQPPLAPSSFPSSSAPASPPSSPTPSSTPTPYLSTLRTALTALVIIHHVAIPYGGTGSWELYTSPFVHHKPFASAPLVALNVLDQTFFMATFFLISGFLSAESAAKLASVRKTKTRTRTSVEIGREGSVREVNEARCKFLKSKWKRLGVPTILYTVLGPPLTRGIVAIIKDGVEGREVGRRMWEEVLRTRGVRGAVWYCAVLLIFDVVYALVCPRHFGGGRKREGEIEVEGGCRRRRRMSVDGTEAESRQPLLLVEQGKHMHDNDGNPVEQEVQEENAEDEESIPAPKRHPTPHPSSIPTPQIILALLLTILTSFLLRIPYPSGIRTFTLLNLNPGYLPQYILFYSTGIAASTYYKLPLHELVARRTRRLLGVIVLVVNVVGFGMVYFAVDGSTSASTSSTSLSKSGTDLSQILPSFSGGPNRFALLYALWNETTGIYLSSLTLKLFHCKCNTTWRLGSLDLARYSYPAFLCHIPVVVFLQCVVDGWDAGGVLKTVVVGVPSVVASWGVGWVFVGCLEGMGFRGYI